MFHASTKTLQGPLLFPSDASYDPERRTFNAMIDARPLAIVQCATTDDVVASVRLAREQNLPVTVRGGGHNVARYAVRDGALLVDLSKMKTIQVNPSKRIARAQPGVRLGEFDQATRAHGLVTTMSIFSTTGIAGLTLGGGLGWLGGKYGLACDNLSAAEVVTADGQVLNASEAENPDLFWGLGGGGGNFRIVTRFDYRLHPLTKLYAGPAPFDLQRPVKHCDSTGNIRKRIPTNFAWMPVSCLARMGSTRSSWLPAGRGLRPKASAKWHR